VAGEPTPDFLDRQPQAERAGLETLVRRYQAAAITPFRSMIGSATATDRTCRTRSLLERGLEGLLGNLGPTTRWRQPVLELQSPVAGELQLSGTGLVLTPAYFCPRQPVIIEAATGPTVLLHPLAPGARPPGKPDRDPRHRPKNLDALMGSTRATMLQTLGEGSTTTELAQRLGVSTACASQHATILREAGLISTHRHGSAVLHIVTALGSAVLQPSERVVASAAR
jgi:hypothetical protein